MLNEIFNEDRMLRRGYKKILCDPLFNEDIVRLIDRFIDSYMEKHDLDVESVIRSYNEFLFMYLEDMKKFILTEKYPCQLGHDVRDMKRVDYDIALMLSTVVASHRYRIIRKVFS